MTRSSSAMAGCCARRMGITWTPTDEPVLPGLGGAGPDDARGRPPVRGRGRPVRPSGFGDGRLDRRGGIRAGGHPARWRLRRLGLHARAERGGQPGDGAGGLCARGRTAPRRDASDGPTRTHRRRLGRGLGVAGLGPVEPGTTDRHRTSARGHVRSVPGRQRGNRHCVPRHPGGPVARDRGGPAGVRQPLHRIPLPSRPTTRQPSNPTST